MGVLRQGPAISLAAMLFLSLSGCAVNDQPTVPPALEIEFDLAAAAARLGKAIQIETVSKDGQTGPNSRVFEEFHRFLADNFPNTHQALSREVVNKHSLLYGWQGADLSLDPIVLTAHMDVVPAGDAGQWIWPAFSGHDSGTAIWGRGALDDKASVLGILEAVETLLNKGHQPRRSVYLAFGHDEERDGSEGAAHIAAHLAQRHKRIEYVLDEGLFIGEGGVVAGIDRPVALIGLAEKGYVTFELTAHAEKGHSSIVPRDTAIGRLARALVRLQEQPMPARLQSPVTEMLEALAPELSTMEQIAIQNRWLLEPLLISQLSDDPESNAMIRTTIAPTIIQNADLEDAKENILPDSVKATVNLRFMPGETISEVQEKIIRRIDDPNISIAILPGHNPPTPVSKITNRNYGALKRTILQIYPNALVAPGLVPAGTDAKHYTALTENVYRFLPIMLQPGDPGRIHGFNERIQKKDYYKTISFYAQLLWNTAIRPNALVE